MTDETPAPLTAEEEASLRAFVAWPGPIWSDVNSTVLLAYLGQALATLDATRARSVPDDRLRDIAQMLHDDVCQEDDCEGWERVSSFGKRGWGELAQRVIARVQGKPDPEWRSADVAALASDATPSTGLDVERLARACCIEAESIESHPTDFDDCPDRDGHIDYARVIAREYAALSASPTETP